MKNPRRGMTLVELLIVISIIAMLMAMLLPAVQSVRESARRATCANNLKQFGTALNSFMASNGHLPPAMGGRLNSNPSPSGGGLPAPGCIVNGRPYEGFGELSGFFFLLPFIGMQPAYDVIANGSFNTNSPPAELMTPAASLLCPSDVPPGYALNFNYLFNAGDAMTGALLHPPRSDLYYWQTGHGADTDCGFEGTYVDGGNTLPYKPILRGLFGKNSRVKPDEILDGSSNTLAMAECVRQQVQGSQPVINQWDATASQYGWNVPSCFANFSGGRYLDGFLTLHNGAPGYNWLNGRGDNCRFVTRLPPNGPSCKYISPPRSRHQGGVTAVFADGAVKFISKNIETRMDNITLPTSVTTPTVHGVWGAMGSRSGSDIVLFAP